MFLKKSRIKLVLDQYTMLKEHNALREMTFNLKK